MIHEFLHILVMCRHVGDTLTWHLLWTLKFVNFVFKPENVFMSQYHCFAGCVCACMLSMHAFTEPLGS